MESKKKKNRCLLCWQEIIIIEKADGQIEIKCGCGSEIFNVKISNFYRELFTVRIENKGG